MFSVIVIINQWIPYYKNIKSPIYSGTLDKCKEYIIEFVLNIFKTLDIDFPMTLDDFEYIWFDSNRIDASSFTYLLIPSDNSIVYSWDEPWSLEDLYEDILEHIYQYEINNSKADNIEDELDIV